jgi:hypothetical protein
MSTSSQSLSTRGDNKVTYNASYDQLTYKSRSIASVLGDADHHRFFVGTLSLNTKNEIHLIEYLEEKKQVVGERILKHQYEIWNIAPHSKQADLLWTVYNTGKNFGTTLWKMDYHNSKNSDLTPMVELSDFQETLQK